MWHNSQSEQVKLKILSVVDRLLDKAVIRHGDPNFSVMFKWLKHLEETISPYKRCAFIPRLLRFFQWIREFLTRPSAEALRLTVQLVKRAKAIQIEPLTPLVSNQLTATFDAWPEFQQLLQFYRI